MPRKKNRRVAEEKRAKKRIHGLFAFAGISFLVTLVSWLLLKYVPVSDARVQGILVFMLIMSAASAVICAWIGIVFALDKGASKIINRNIASRDQSN